ncbi:MAG: DNA repair protein RadC [Prevotella sp.]|nr:DNA repair protein RadC [Prevotella sp.]
MKKLSINQWAEEDRPREKLMRLGARELSNAELLAIIIGSGSADESAVELMQRLLADCGNNLNTLGKMSIRQLTDARYKGLGTAKAVALLAVCELGKRRAAMQPEERPTLNTARAIYDLMHPKLQDLDNEEAWLVLMNHAYKLIKVVPISRGGITETAVDVRIILREALISNATVLALVHNHPSGSPSPSSHDDRLTQHVKKACDTMRLHFADHVIITDGDYFSYNENGKI